MINIFSLNITTRTIALLSLSIMLWMNTAAQQHVLWRADMEGKNVFHLVATVHSKDPAAYNYPVELDSIIKQADHYAHGANFYEFKPRSYAYFMNTDSLGGLPGRYDSTLVDSVHQAAISNLGAASVYLDKIAPFYIETMMISMRANADKPLFQDDYLRELAIKNNAKEYRLEQVGHQVEAYNELDMNDQYQELIKYVRTINQQDSVQNALIAHYGTWNLQAIDSIYQSGKVLGWYGMDLTSKRNKRMVSVLDSMNQNLVLALDVRHFVGPEGIQHLITDRGWTLTPIGLQSKKWDFALDTTNWRTVHHVDSSLTTTISFKMPDRPAYHEEPGFGPDSSSLFMEYKYFDQENNVTYSVDLQKYQLDAMDLEQFNELVNIKLNRLNASYEWKPISDTTMYVKNMEQRHVELAAHTGLNVRFVFFATDDLFVGVNVRGSRDLIFSSSSDYYINQVIIMTK